MVKNSTEMVVERSTTKTFHHMSSHHSKTNWSIGGGSSAAGPSRGARWNRKTQSWESKRGASKPVAPKPVAKKTVAKPAPKENKRPVNVVPKKAPVAKKASTGRRTGGFFDRFSTNKSSSSNAFASNARPECGNAMTGRPSTRVHAPPGGRSQITFG